MLSEDKQAGIKVVAEDEQWMICGVEAYSDGDVGFCFWFCPLDSVDEKEMNERGNEEDMSEALVHRQRWLKNVILCRNLAETCGLKPLLF